MSVKSPLTGRGQRANRAELNGYGLWIRVFIRRVFAAALAVLMFHLSFPLQSLLFLLSHFLA